MVHLHYDFPEIPPPPAPVPRDKDETYFLNWACPGCPVKNKDGDKMHVANKNELNLKGDLSFLCKVKIKKNDFSRWMQSWIVDWCFNNMWRSHHQESKTIMYRQLVMILNSCYKPDCLTYTQCY